MNSLLGGKGGMMTIMMQAFAAMKNGQSAEDFMMNLAKTSPELKGLDLTNLEQTAHQLSSQKGVDENAMANRIQNMFGSIH